MADLMNFSAKLFKYGLEESLKSLLPFLTNTNELKQLHVNITFLLASTCFYLLKFKERGAVERIEKEVDYVRRFRLKRFFQFVRQIGLDVILFVNLKPSTIYNLTKVKVDTLAQELKSHFRYNGNKRFLQYFLPSLQPYLTDEIKDVFKALDGTDESFQEMESSFTKQITFQ